MEQNQTTTEQNNNEINDEKKKKLAERQATINNFMNMKLSELLDGKTLKKFYNKYKDSTGEVLNALMQYCLDDKLKLVKKTKEYWDIEK